MKSSYLLKSHKVLMFIFFLIGLSSCLNNYSLPLSLPYKKPKGIYHTVKKNETFWRICKTYGVNIQEVAELNNIKNVSQIKSGDNIFIPDAEKTLRVPTVANEKETIEKVNVTKKTKREIVKYPDMFLWPVKGDIIKSFGIYQGLKHDGINIKAPLGSSINAANSGKVAFSSPLQGYGNTIIIQHKKDYATVYANNGENLVRKGQWVERGQKIAKIGPSSGTGSIPYLHFQIRKNNLPRNPLFYLPNRS